MLQVFVRHPDGKVEERPGGSDVHELLQDSQSCVWVDIEGESPDALEAVGRQFGLHPVTIEDLLHRNQRPKLEEFDTYIFVVVHGLKPVQGEDVPTEEFNIAVGKNWVLSVHDGANDLIKRVYDQVVSAPKALDGGPSLLLHRISDLLVDSYFPPLEELGEEIDALEDDVVQRPTKDRLHRIFTLKRLLVHLRKLVSPQREVYNALSRRDYPYIDPKSAAYFRDLHDHLLRANEIVESYRDLVSNLLDIYLATISNRLNEVMRRLTIIATIFMPLSFITGFFGMNFTGIPYGWSWLLGGTILAVAIVPLAMLIWFIKSGWIGDSDS
jgi:magnesium transporter